MLSRVNQNTESTLNKVQTPKAINQFSSQPIPTSNFNEQFVANDCNIGARPGKGMANNSFTTLLNKVKFQQMIKPGNDQEKITMGIVNDYGITPNGELMPNPIDQNSDGSIDKSEMQALVDKLAEHTGQSVSVEELFSQFDADKDQMLNADEAKEALAYVFENMKPYQLANPIDQNSDGSIDKIGRQ